MFAILFFVFVSTSLGPKTLLFIFAFLGRFVLLYFQCSLFGFCLEKKRFLLPPPPEKGIFVDFSVFPFVSPKFIFFTPPFHFSLSLFFYLSLFFLSLSIYLFLFSLLFDVFCFSCLVSCYFINCSFFCFLFCFVLQVPVLCLLLFILNCVFCSTSNFSFNKNIYNFWGKLGVATRHYLLIILFSKLSFLAPILGTIMLMLRHFSTENNKNGQNNTILRGYYLCQAGG